MAQLKERQNFGYKIYLDEMKPEQYLINSLTNRTSFIGHIVLFLGHNWALLTMPKT